MVAFLSPSVPFRAMRTLRARARGSHGWILRGGGSVLHWRRLPARSGPCWTILAGCSARSVWPKRLGSLRLLSAPGGMVSGARAERLARLFGWCGPCSYTLRGCAQCLTWRPGGGFESRTGSQRGAWGTGQSDCPPRVGREGMLFLGAGGGCGNWPTAGPAVHRGTESDKTAARSVRCRQHVLILAPRTTLPQPVRRHRPTQSPNGTRQPCYRRMMNYSNRWNGWVNPED